MKNRKTTKIVIGLMILSSIYSTILASALSQGQQKGPLGPPIDFPGQLQINMTDTTPNRYQHMVQANEPQLFRFRNMTMYFNASHNLRLNITAQNQMRVRYFSLNVGTNRSLSLNIMVNKTPPTDSSKPNFGLEKYFTIEPNATAPLRAMLCIYLNTSELETELNRKIWRERLTWCFWNGTEWSPVRSNLTEDDCLLTETSHFSSWTVMEKRQPNEIPTPNIPGVPHETQAFNYTDTVPNRFNWTIKERSQNLLTFKNMAMLINSSKQLQLQITQETQVQQRLFKIELDTDDPARLTMNIRNSKPEEVEPAENHIGFYLEAESNLTSNLQARLGVDINTTQIKEQTGLNVDPNKLTWAFWNGTHWEQVESTLNEDNILQAGTSHFSIWTVMETSEQEPVVSPTTEPTSEPTSSPTPLPTPTPTPKPTQEPAPATQLQIYAIIALMIIGAAAYILYKRQG